MGNKSEDGFGCGGWWVLFLDESPDLGVLFWVTKRRMSLGGTKLRGCKEGRMRMLCNRMGCKSLIWGVLSNGVCRDTKGVYIEPLTQKSPSVS